MNFYFVFFYFMKLSLLCYLLYICIKYDNNFDILDMVKLYNFELKSLEKFGKGIEFEIILSI